jgi:hypothetical protein
MKEIIKIIILLIGLCAAILTIISPIILMYQYKNWEWLFTILLIPIFIWYISKITLGLVSLFEN